MLSDSIRILRERKGLSQVELAERAGMKKPQLCVIEKGVYRPRKATLARLASALGMSCDELLRADSKLMAPTPLVPLFAADADRIDERRRAERASARMDAADNARGVVSATTLPLVHAFLREAHAGVYLAQAMRSALGAGTGAFADLVWELELANVRLHAQSLSEERPCMAWWHEDRKALTIAVNRSCTPERQLYGIACALGAACLFRSSGDTPLADGKREHRLVSDFAAEFLMPATAVTRMAAALGIGRIAWTQRRLCLFKAHFGVSAEAFALRLEELGLIDPELRRRLRDELRAHYKRRPDAMEPVPRKGPLPFGRRWEIME